MHLKRFLCEHNRMLLVNDGFEERFVAGTDVVVWVGKGSFLDGLDARCVHLGERALHAEMRKAIRRHRVDIVRNGDDSILAVIVP